MTINILDYSSGKKTVMAKARLDAVGRVIFEGRIPPAILSDFDEGIGPDRVRPKDGEKFLAELPHHFRGAWVRTEIV